MTTTHVGLAILTGLTLLIAYYCLQHREQQRNHERGKDTE